MSERPRSTEVLDGIYEALRQHPEGLTIASLRRSLGGQPGVRGALQRLRTQGRAYERNDRWFHVPGGDRADRGRGRRPRPDPVQVRTEVEAVLRAADRPLWLFDLRARCSGHVAQIEAALEALATEGQIHKAHNGWVIHADRNPQPDDARPPVSGSSRYDAWVAKAIAVVEASPEGTDAVRVAKQLRLDPAVAHYVLRLAWGRGRIDSQRFDRWRVFFPAGAPRVPPAWIGGDKDPHEPQAPPVRARMTLDERAHAVVPEVSAFVNRQPEPVSSRTIADKLEVEPKIVTRALRLAWSWGLVVGEGRGGGRRYRGVGTKTPPPPSASLPTTSADPVPPPRAKATPPTESELLPLVREAVVAWASRTDPEIGDRLTGQDLYDLADALIECVA